MTDSPKLKLTLPKGRIQERLVPLLASIGLEISMSHRSYRPICSDPTVEMKILKPHNIASLVALGRHDCGFTGYDTVVEHDADVTELMDLGFDPVRIVAAAPEDLAPKLMDNADLGRPLVIASEYEKLTKDYIAKKGWNAVYLRTYGATEALPPEDADLIIDNTATGSTLRMNRLTIVDEVMRSTTRFIANPEAMKNPWKRQRMEEMVVLMKSTMAAAERVLLEMNVAKDKLDAVVNSTPAMRSPTVAPLYGEEGFAVKVAVSTKEVAQLIPKLVEAGARDILEYKLEKIVF